MIAGLADSDYDRIVIETVREASTPDGADRDSRTSAWLDGFFAERSVGWFAMFLPVHMSEHLGEALAIRGPARSEYRRIAACRRPGANERSVLLAAPVTPNAEVRAISPERKVYQSAPVTWFVIPNP